MEKAFSPVAVFTQLLRRHGQGPWTPWSRGALKLVTSVLRENAHLLTQVEGPWAELCKLLPPSAWSPLGEEGAERCEVDPKDTSRRPLGTLRATRDTQRRSLVVYDRLSAEDRTVEIESLLEYGTAAFQSGDPDMMLQAVLRCVGFLASPRGVASHVSDATAHNVQANKVSLARVQDLLLKLLGFHESGGGLDLHDEGTRKLLSVPIQRLHHMLTRRQPQSWQAS